MRDLSKSPHFDAVLADIERDNTLLLAVGHGVLIGMKELEGLSQFVDEPTCYVVEFNDDAGDPWHFVIRKGASPCAG